MLDVLVICLFGHLGLELVPRLDVILTGIGLMWANLGVVVNKLTGSTLNLIEVFLVHKEMLTI